MISENLSLLWYKFQHKNLVSPPKCHLKGFHTSFAPPLRIKKYHKWASNPMLHLQSKYEIWFPSKSGVI